MVRSITPVLFGFILLSSFGHSQIPDCNELEITAEFKQDAFNYVAAEIVNSSLVRTAKESSIDPKQSKEIFEDYISLDDIKGKNTEATIQFLNTKIDDAIGKVKWKEGEDIPKVLNTIKSYYNKPDKGIGVFAEINHRDWKNVKTINALIQVLTDKMYKGGGRNDLLSRFKSETHKALKDNKAWTEFTQKISRVVNAYWTTYCKQNKVTVYTDDEIGNELILERKINPEQIKTKRKIGTIVIHNIGDLQKDHFKGLWQENESYKPPTDLDKDKDGVPNDEDAFPDDPKESKDSDGDGIGDNSDTDLDGDGVENDEDAFPENPKESKDSDGDGIGDNSDTDLDGDGVENDEDAFPDNPKESKDLDKDGIGDNSDPDRDGDGVENDEDAFPENPKESKDLDKDGIGDNSDPDRDGDGVENDKDDFPDDPTRSVTGDTDTLDPNVASHNHYGLYAGLIILGILVGWLIFQRNRDSKKFSRPKSQNEERPEERAKNYDSEFSDLTQKLNTVSEKNSEIQQEVIKIMERQDELEKKACGTNSPSPQRHSKKRTYHK